MCHLVTQTALTLITLIIRVCFYIFGVYNWLEEDHKCDRTLHSHVCSVRADF